jgi:hypothetical protein
LSSPTSTATGERITSPGAPFCLNVDRMKMPGLRAAHPSSYARPRVRVTVVHDDFEWDEAKAASNAAKHA